VWHLFVELGAAHLVLPSFAEMAVVQSDVILEELDAGSDADFERWLSTRLREERENISNVMTNMVSVLQESHKNLLAEASSLRTEERSRQSNKRRKPAEDQLNTSERSDGVAKTTEGNPAQNTPADGDNVEQPLMLSEGSVTSKGEKKNKVPKVVERGETQDLSARARDLVQTKAANLHRISSGINSPRHKSSKMMALMGEDTEAMNNILHKIVSHSYFEFASGLIISLNTMVLALELQYSGLERGQRINYPGYTDSPEDLFPFATSAFKGADYMFNIMFILEFILRVMDKRLRSVRSFWLWLDAVLVTMGVLNWFQHTEGLNATTLRVVRLARMIRVARIIRVVKAFDGLFLLIRSIEASFGALFWSFIVLLTAQMAAGMCVSQIVSNFIDDSSQDLEKRQAVFRYWGTFGQTMITMFEITMANWIVSARVLMDNISEWFGVFYVLYRCMFCFAVLRVITAVFIAETQRAVSSDDEIAIMRKQRARDFYIQKLTEVFEELDINGDGSLSQDEFSVVFSDPLIKTWLATLDVEVHQLEGMFRLLDDGDGRIAIEEFMQGVSRMKGAAKSIDLVTLLTLTKRMDSRLETRQQRILQILRSIYAGLPGPGNLESSREASELAKFAALMKCDGNTYTI